MFVPPSRIFAMFVVATVIATTSSKADQPLPPVDTTTAPVVVPAMGTKPLLQAEPRVFASGPVLKPNATVPVAIPSADEPVTKIPSPPAETESEAIVAPEQTARAAASTGELESMAPATSIIQEFYEPLNPITPYCNPRVPLAQNWVSVETLIWWTSDTNTPVLASTSPINANINQAGVLGGNTQPLFGGNEIFDDVQGGFRLKAGNWRNGCDGSGFSGEFLMLPSRGHDFYAGTDGDPILARPIFNAATNQQDAQLIGYPGQYRGRLHINAETRMYSFAGHFWGELYDAGCECDSCGESWRSANACSSRNSDGSARLGLKIGPRFVHLDDTLLIDETAVRIASGGNFRIIDSFKTENSFLGGEIGIRARRVRGALDFELGLQLAIGATRQELDVRGLTVHTPAQGATSTSNVGVLALGSNSGSWDRDRFSVIPGLEVAIGCELKDGWRATLGYQFMYWTNVLRASEQIDPTVDTSQLHLAQGTPTLSRPAVRWNESDYLAQGISVGLEKRW